MTAFSLLNHLTEPAEMILWGAWPLLICWTNRSPYTSRYGKRVWDPERLGLGSALE